MTDSGKIISAFFSKMRCRILLCIVDVLKERKQICVYVYLRIMAIKAAQLERYPLPKTNDLLAGINNFVYQNRPK